MPVDLPPPPEAELEQALLPGAAITQEIRAAALPVFQAGEASWYTNRTRKLNRRMADGTLFNAKELVAAHRIIPFGTRVLVTNVENGESVEVVIRDRGPHRRGRIIDVSEAAAVALGFKHLGTAKVELRVLP